MFNLIFTIILQSNLENVDEKAIQNLLQFDFIKELSVYIRSVCKLFKINIQ